MTWQESILSVFKYAAGPGRIICSFLASFARPAKAHVLTYYRLLPSPTPSPLTNAAPTKSSACCRMENGIVPVSHSKGRNARSRCLILESALVWKEKWRRTQHYHTVLMLRTKSLHLSGGRTKTRSWLFVFLNLLLEKGWEITCWKPDRCAFRIDST